MARQPRAQLGLYIVGPLVLVVSVTAALSPVRQTDPGKKFGSIPI